MLLFNPPSNRCEDFILLKKAPSLCDFISQG
jgi:hypothetical protein